MDRRTFIKGAVVAASTPAAAFAPPALAASLATLIERHRLAIVEDRAAWDAVADVDALLDTIPGRNMPKVHISNVLSWNGTERVSTPTYAYSEEAIRKPILQHMEGQMAMAGTNEVMREKIRQGYMAKLEEKLADFRAQEAVYKQQEDEAGYTAAMEKARAAANVVRALEADIIAFVPQPLQDASTKAAWIVWAYEDDFCYLADTKDGPHVLVTALTAIARAVA